MAIIATMAMGRRKKRGSELHEKEECTRDFQARSACALGKITLEIPAGKIDPGEAPETCALRELSEETGYTSNNIIYLGELHTSVGFCNEVIYMYAATDLVRHELSPDEDEFLTLSAIPMDVFEEMCVSGEITDSKTLSAVLKVAALRRRGKI